MPSSTQFPGTATDAGLEGSSWANTGNALANDGSVASNSRSGFVAGAMEGLDLTNFGFNATIPSGSTIDGIEATFDRRETSGLSNIRDHTIQLIVGGSPTGDNKASASEYPTSLAEATYGGASDLWGLTPSYAQVAASNFGVRFRSQSVGTTTNPHITELDYGAITVHYTEGLSTVVKDIIGPGLIAFPR